MNIYLIWSIARGAWWRENGSGYTQDLWNAGRFDETEALKGCASRTWSIGAPPPEVMVLAPEHDTPTFTVEDIRSVPELMRQRIVEATQRRMRERGAP